MTASLVDRAARNLALHAGWIQRHLPGMQCYDELGLQLADSGLACDTFNTVCHARLTPDRATRSIAAALDHFHSATRPFSWWLGPGDQPGHLDRLLTDAGLVATDSEAAMAADLANLAAQPSDDAIRIARIRTEADLDRFAAVLAAHWDPPDHSVLTFYGAAAGLLLSPDCPFRLYLAWLEGDAVGTAEVTIEAGVAGLYNVATSLPHRGRGIGSHLVTGPLFEAWREGITTGILQAAPGAQSLYQRLGFRTFGRYTELKRPPSSSSGPSAGR